MTYFIPNNSELAFMIPRYFFAFVFVVFLPGYCLVNFLFIGKNRLDFVEEIVLFLGLSPIGIDFIPITVSLTIIVLIFATGTFLRKRKELPVLQMKSPQQVST
jgi:uncharacterized membrane protein